MSREIKFRAWDADGRYEVGSNGSVFSNNYNNTGNRHEMKQYLDDDGYPYVILRSDGRRQKKAVHRLVASLFLEKPSEKHQVNHKNGVRDDNRLVNLEWVTSRENTLHGYRVNGRTFSPRLREEISSRVSGSGNPKAKMDHTKVKELRQLREDGMQLKELASKYGISVAQAGAIANNKYWK